MRVAQEAALEASRSRRPDFTAEDHQPFFRLDADRHFLLVAARNLLRALGRLGMTEELPGALAETVKLLRNCFEHWDEHEAAFDPDTRGGLAIRNHRERQPLLRPDTHQWGSNGTLIGGELRVEDLEEHVSRVHDKLVEMETAGDFSLLSPYQRKDQ